MKIILTSDTHSFHDKIHLPEGDMIIPAGDVSNKGTYGEATSFLHWFKNLPLKHKVFIAGNHDFIFEKNPPLDSSNFPEGITYLQNSAIEIEGVSIYGSPYTPEFYNWAFMKKRGEEMRQIWNMITNTVDILITHGPPITILDKSISGRLCGCEELLKRVTEIQPKVHVFGHIHEAYGMVEKSGTHFYNASILDESYRVKNKPFVIDVD